jgi:hypothetical protein
LARRFTANRRRSGTRRGPSRLRTRRRRPRGARRRLRPLIYHRARKTVLRASRGLGVWRRGRPGRGWLHHPLLSGFSAPGSHDCLGREGLPGSARPAAGGTLAGAVRPVLDQRRGGPGRRIAPHGANRSRRAGSRRRGALNPRRRAARSRNEMSSAARLCCGGSPTRSRQRLAYHSMRRGRRRGDAAPIAKLGPWPRARTRLRPAGRREVRAVNC